jgi:hypothetical protein
VDVTQIPTTGYCVTLHQKIDLQLKKIALRYKMKKVGYGKKALRQNV